MSAEVMPVSLIFTNNFPKNLKFDTNELYISFEEKDDNAAFERLKKNIEKGQLYNAILSGHKTVKDGYGLLKSFLDYNINEGYYFDNSNYPFFIFIENENFNKKKLYSYYLEQEKERQSLDEEFKIDSKIILFSNISNNVKTKLNNVSNYYHRKNVEIRYHPYNSSFIKIMYVGVTGTGKSTLINELNGEKISYSSSENQMKTKDNSGGKRLTFKNSKFPILNQDTEGFEIGDDSQIKKVNNNILKNFGKNFNERLHIVIILLKNERGLDNNDIALMAKLHEMKILYYALYPRCEGKDNAMQGKTTRLINSLIMKFSNNTCDENIKKLFEDFKDTKKLIKILKEILGKANKIVFSANILAKDSKGKINLLKKIKEDLFGIYEIHQKFIKSIDKAFSKTESVQIGISGHIKKTEDMKYYEILNDSPFFFNFSINDIKREEAERLLVDCDVSSFWLFFYNKKVENFRKEILQKIKNIYSEVNVETEINNNVFDNNESWFYKTENTKQFIKKLIDFFDQKYKELEKNKKYYSQCENYNKSIKVFGEYVEEFCNSKLNGEQILYDIDLV